jgi:hypothetical protein
VTLPAPPGVPLISVPPPAIRAIFLRRKSGIATAVRSERSFFLPGASSGQSGILHPRPQQGPADLLLRVRAGKPAAPQPGGFFRENCALADAGGEEAGPARPRRPPRSTDRDLFYHQCMLVIENVNLGFYKSL